MTDAPEEPPAFATERGGVRRPRVGESGSPVGSTLSIILAVIAVIAGFLILRAITDDDGDGGTGAIADPNTTTPATVGPGPITVTSGTTIPVPTVPAGPVYSGATIVVANASGISGSAAAMTNALTTEGYEGVGEPGNASEALTTSVVYYVAGDTAAQAVAQSIATAFGGVQVGELPEPRPASGGDVDSATVLVMLGPDAAEKTLAELSGAPGTPSETVVPPPAVITQP